MFPVSTKRNCQWSCTVTPVRPSAVVVGVLSTTTGPLRGSGGDLPRYRVPVVLGTDDVFLAPTALFGPLVQWVGVSAPEISWNENLVSDETLRGGRPADAGWVGRPRRGPTGATRSLVLRVVVTSPFHILLILCCRGTYGKSVFVAGQEIRVSRLTEQGSFGVGDWCTSGDWCVPGSYSETFSRPESLPVHSPRTPPPGTGPSRVNRSVPVPFVHCPTPSRPISLLEDLRVSSLGPLRTSGATPCRVPVPVTRGRRLEL